MSMKARHRTEPDKRRRVVRLAISAEDIEDVEEHGHMNVTSHEISGERPDRQSWEWHQGKRLLALARRMRRALRGAP